MGFYILCYVCRRRAHYLDTLGDAWRAKRQARRHCLVSGHTVALVDGATVFAYRRLDKLVHVERGEVPDEA